MEFQVVSGRSTWVPVPGSEVILNFQSIQRKSALDGGRTSNDSDVLPRGRLSRERVQLVVWWSCEARECLRS